MLELHFRKRLLQVICGQILQKSWKLIIRISQLITSLYRCIERTKLFLYRNERTVKRSIGGECVAPLKKSKETDFRSLKDFLDNLGSHSLFLGCKKNIQLIFLNNFIYFEHTHVITTKMLCQNW